MCYSIIFQAAALIVFVYVTPGLCGNAESLCVCVHVCVSVLQHQKIDDEEPDVLFIKEEHSELEEQDTQTRGGMTLQDGESRRVRGSD